MTPLEITQWLDSRGGRDLNDLYEDKEGYLYVMMMGCEGREVKVYLPEYVWAAQKRDKALSTST